jgi:hypothetical protein
MGRAPGSPGRLLRTLVGLSLARNTQRAGAHRFAKGEHALRESALLWQGVVLANTRHRQ